MNEVIFSAITGILLILEILGIIYVTFNDNKNHSSNKSNFKHRS